MRALLERSKTVRGMVVVMAAAAALLLARGADAGDDLGIRRATFMPDGLFAAFGTGSAAPAAVQAPRADADPVLPPAAHPKRRSARRIWAAAHGRPLRIVLERRHVRTRTARAQERGTGRREVAAAAPPPVRLIPPPPRVALVSIYEDHTLRSGDAVMLADGVHVFRDDGFWPHRPRDFVSLRQVAGLDWHLRQTLQPYDHNPPTRWTAIMVPPA